MAVHFKSHQPGVNVKGLKVSFTPTQIVVSEGILTLRGQRIRVARQGFRVSPSDLDRTFSGYVLANGVVSMSEGWGLNRPQPPRGVVYKLFSGSLEKGKALQGGEWYVRAEGVGRDVDSGLPADTPAMQAAQPKKKSKKRPPPLTELPQEKPETETEGESAPETPETPQEPDTSPSVPETPEVETPETENEDADEEAEEEAAEEDGELEEEAEEEEADEETFRADVFAAIGKCLKAKDTVSSGAPTVAALRDALEAAGYDDLEVDSEFRDEWYETYEAANSERSA